MRAKTQRGTYVRADFFKAVYAACLKNLTIEEIVDIFRNQDEYNPFDLLTLIWNEKGQIPLCTMIKVTNRLEKILIRSDRDPQQFMSNAVLDVNKGTMMSANTVLDIIEPFFVYFFKKNFRELILDNIKRINSILIPGTHHIVCQKMKTQSALNYVTLIDLTSDTELNLNGNNWLQPLIKALGYGFGYPLLEEVVTIAEIKTIEEIMHDYSRHIENLNKKNLYTTKILLSKFLEENEIAIPEEYACKSYKVQIIQKTIYDNAGKPVLYENCCYGAPFFLFRINAKRNVARSRLTIKRIIDEAVRGKVSIYDTFTHEHKKVLRCFDSLYNCIYDSATQVLSVNKTKVTSGVPAKIIAKVLKEYDKYGQTEFSNGFFAEDESIIKHKLDKSFNVNIKRAISNLKNKAPSIELVRKTGSGMIQLNVSCELSYEEI